MTMHKEQIARQCHIGKCGCPPEEHRVLSSCIRTVALQVARWLNCKMGQLKCQGLLLTLSCQHYLCLDEHEDDIDLHLLKSDDFLLALTMVS